MENDLLSTSRLRFDPNVDPNSLKPHLLNWRKHGPRQRKAFAALLSKVGWAGVILVNETTGRMLDGHMRVEEAIHAKLPSVPVLYGQWTEEQERQILLSFDAIGALAEINSAALASLSKTASADLAAIADKNTSEYKAIKNLNQDLSHHAKEVSRGSRPSITLEPTTRNASKDTEGPMDNVLRSPREAEFDLPAEAIKTLDLLGEDPIFESESPWEIPELLPDRLCQEVPTHTWDRSPESTTCDAWYCYSAGANTLPSSESRSNGGFLGFFTEDFRFEMAWNESRYFASRLYHQKWTGVCAPDFSTWSDWPFPIRLHNIYRSRWCARYWQEINIPVIPILQGIGSGPCEDDFLINSIVLDSLPREIPVMAIQIRTSKEKDLEHWEGIGELITMALKQIKVKHLILYGGVERKKYIEGHLPRTKTEFIFLPAFQTLRLAKRAKEKEVALA